MSLPNQNSISTPEAINILEYYLIARPQSKIPDISIISFIALFSPNWDPIEIHRVHLVISLYLVFSLLELFSSEVKLTFNFNASILNVHLMSFIHTHTYIYILLQQSPHQNIENVPSCQLCNQLPLHHPAPVNHWSDFFSSLQIALPGQELHKSNNLDLLLLCLASFAQHIFENHLSYCIYEKLVHFY